MNSIITRVADFLKDFQPFNNLSNNELIEVAKNTKIINIEKNKTLFQIDDPLHDSFYIVASGSMNLFVVSDAEESLLNKCNVGDIFGLRPFFAKNNYMMTAKARTESILYAIPIETFKPFVSQNPEVLNFLLQSFAMNSTNSSDNEIVNKSLADNFTFTDKKSEIQFYQSLNYNKTPLTTNPDVTIKEVARLMTDYMMDNIVVLYQNKPVGIVTDTDFCVKIGTGRFFITDTIDKIMSYPVITVEQNISLPEAQLIMLKNNVSHLCVTADGSDKSELKGIISEHDLIVAQANNPGVLIKEIKRATEAITLNQIRGKLTDLIQNLISRNIPLSHIYNISGEITHGLIKRAIELAILDLGSPPARFAWFSIGSQGRKEQLLLTDQDSFLVFEDVPNNKYRDTKDYFLKLSKKVVATLEKTGFSPCPNGNTAGNMQWCKSLTEWIKEYNTWMITPSKNADVFCNLFFDYQIVFGDVQIENALNETVFHNLKNNTLFFDYLGNDTLRKPAPLSFFKKFILEEEGPNTGKFDIKNKALMILVDAARLLILSHSVEGINNTYSRFKQLAMIEPRHAEIYQNCAEAFLLFSKFKTLEGLKNDNSGQYLNLEDISKSDKEKIKNTLNVIKDIEELIKEKFKLTKFS